MFSGETLVLEMHARKEKHMKGVLKHRFPLYICLL
jgi:hypothetical protein